MLKCGRRKTGKVPTYEGRMRIIFALVLIAQLSHQQTYIENPTYPPHGCENFGVCSQPVEEYAGYFFGDEYYYTCAPEHCVCNNGTSGPACTTIEDLCVTLNPCPSVNGSRYKCTSGTGTYKCECAVGYTGEKCDKDAKSICKWDTCLNGGTCTTTNNIVYKCLCKPEYIGSRCQNKNPCLSKTCLNNGTCEPIFDGADFRCNCGPYYQQEYCAWSKLVWTPPPLVEQCLLWVTYARVSETLFCILLTPPLAPNRNPKLEDLEFEV
ncbi:EGF-like domain protein [Ostertagia ostertagi]